MSKVVVVGSINIDMTVETPRLPAVGETVLGGDFAYFLGGKGSNQAVAAARFGAPVALLAKIGTDELGSQALEQLAKENIQVASILRSKQVPTGVATIFKMATENAILVAPGANQDLQEEELAEDFVEAGDVLVVQLEIPFKTVARVLRRAKELGATTILNPAPYHERTAELLPYVDYLTPNETEFGQLVGKPLATLSEQKRAMQSWAREEHPTLVVTLGAEGTAYLKAGEVIVQPTIEVDVVDSTGAGDTFTGIFAAALSQGYTPEAAIQLAGVGASLAVEAVGAQTAMPSKAVIVARGKE